MSKDITEIKESIKKIDDSLQKNFAGKWVEKFAIAIITIACLAVVYYIFRAAGLPTPDGH
jgi:hypothetical protein